MPKSICLRDISKSLFFHPVLYLLNPESSKTTSLTRFSRIPHIDFPFFGVRNDNGSGSYYTISRYLHIIGNTLIEAIVLDYYQYFV